MPRLAFAGGMLLGLGIAFFLAATNTLAGWLFVLSGLILAMLLLSWGVGGRQLSQIEVETLPLPPIMAGSEAQVMVVLSSRAPYSLSLFQVVTPFAAHPQAVAELPPQTSLPLPITLKPLRRGMYDWPGVTLQTAAPLGLLWLRRYLRDPQRLLVYPQVVPVSHCPLLQGGLAAQARSQPQTSQAQAASEGTTRGLRPYRRGDPLRYIHWRTSARYGELRTRELESQRDGQPLYIAVDHRPGWSEVAFEQALSAVASLYRWAQAQGMEIHLWLESGPVSGERAILTALASLSATASHIPPPPTPHLWATWDPGRPAPPAGWWLIWDPYYLCLDPEQDLALQLRQLPRRWE
ncbi:MAG: DUF58 domain-containing protein [Thermostichales cyanobacterium BF4_bins_65]